MNIKEMHELQEIFDQRIAEAHGITEPDMQEERHLALLVEIGEAANEVRSFKFWSGKGQSDDVVILDEIADCMHFMISIGNFNRCHYNVNQSDTTHLEHININSLFIMLYEGVVRFRNSKKLESYTAMWDYLITIAKKLNFSLNQLEKAYYDKLQVNHIRQDNGY